MKRIIVGLSVVCLIAAMMISCAPPAEAPVPVVPPAAPVAPPVKPPVKPEVINVTLAGAGATSGYFVWHVALGRAITKYTPNINCTVVEAGGGTLLTLEGLRDGFWDIAGYGSYIDLQQLVEGTGFSEGKPFPEARVLMHRQPYYLQNIVRVDSGITTWAELEGKKFWPGMPGSVAQDVCLSEIAGTGLNVEMMTGSFGDACKMLEDNRIVGLNKSCMHDALDAGVKAVSVLTPLRLIGLTEEEVKQTEAYAPKYAGGFVWYEVGTCKDLPESGDFYVYRGIPFIVSSTRMSEDVIYEIVKALYEHYDEVQLAFPTVAGVDPIVDLIKASPEAAVTAPLHAGVVRYCKEVGIEVPAWMIPPEYKG